MPVRQYRPTSPGRRGMSVSKFEEITRSKPERSLLVSLPKAAGRNNQGRITTRHRGGGAKRQYRIIDFKRNKHGIPARVVSIEYDRSEEHTSELQSHSFISYAVFCLKKK